MPKEKGGTIVVITSPDGDPDQHHAVRRLFKVFAKEKQEAQNRSRAIKKSKPYKEGQQRAKENRSKALKLADSLRQKPAGMSLAQRVRNKWGDNPPSLRQIQRYLKDSAI
jgi:hypothetical protein